MLTIKEKKEATVVLNDCLDYSMQPELKSVLEKLEKEGFLLIKLDFASVKSIDNKALAFILVFQKQFKEKGGELQITNVLNPLVESIFSKIHLDKVIKII